jgi:hypothetical protein
MNDKAYRLERRWLQISILMGACVPVLAGVMGMIYGGEMLSDSTDISLDSHIRYLSGLLFAIGIGFWAAIPDIEKKTSHVRLLAFLVVIGGAARLAGTIFIGIPSTPMLLAIGMELIVTPLLCLWQSRIATKLLAS